MTSNNVSLAIDLALKLLGVNKICYAVEDADAYYFTGCGDNGEPLFSDAGCSVDKKTMVCKYRSFVDSCWDTPKTPLQIPEDKKAVYIEETTLLI